MNVLFPLIETHASEYVPNIMKLFEKISENGYEYGSYSMICFALLKFNKKHIYATFEADEMGHIIALSVQERALTTSEIANKDKEKHNKSGEPVCLSPRNFRQPRYHIQRGVMASNVLDKN
ncbi:unnamed protein product [Rotaria sordida]|uniref:tRNA synthetases class I catalytic domain-containing protein n=1 Tax=Rotaria sordida TaxID=392033 RepID=A0A819ELU7_9BILA|nr:unnamed protein product [Rotaria sordida]CAF3853391.1 unnamed protein product [Rotaria sordida]CAF4016214.1 unnamed protein product [Rotaria sordida]